MTYTTSPQDRLEYPGLNEKPHFTLPSGVRLVVWVIVNVEFWDIANPMPRTILPQPSGATRLPDIANWAWHEYGMRRGFWRLKSVLDELGIIPTLSCNGHVCQAYPQIAQSAKDSGWEFMGHGYKQIPMHNLDDQQLHIKKTITTIAEFTGKAPVGWLGPGLTETNDTLDLLSENGIQYVGDWVVDDVPVPLKVKTGDPMLAMPYTVELNDIPMIAVKQIPITEFQNRCRDQFEQLYLESEQEARILSLAVHPFIMGVPHRIKYFKQILEMFAAKPNVEFWTGERIMHWYNDNN